MAEPFYFLYEHLDWKQTKTDWPNSEGLYQRIRFIKGARAVLSDWKPFTVTWGHTDMDWKLAVNGHQVLVDRGALSKLNFYTHTKMDLRRKVPLSLKVNTSGGNCSSWFTIAIRHQCGKEGKWLWHARKGELGRPIKLNFCPSLCQAWNWTAGLLVTWFSWFYFELLLSIFAKILSEFKRQTELLRETYFQHFMRIRLPPLQLSLRCYSLLDTLDIISGELDKVVVKVWRCPCSLKKQEKTTGIPREIIWKLSKCEFSS